MKSNSPNPTSGPYTLHPTPYTLYLCAALIGSQFFVGCKENHPPRQAYTGPTETMAQVVAAINHNNTRIPSLWASIDQFDANIVDNDGKKRHELLHGTLLYRAPDDIVVSGSKDPVGKVVEIGSNRDLYWLITTLPGETSTAWWGRYKYIGAPGAQPIPVRPDLVLAVLGVSTVNTDFTALPAPVMRFNPNDDAYMFIWIARLPDRWVATKEIWYDRQTKRPTRVALFDENGRTILGAFLSRPTPVEIPNTPRSDWPVVAGHYDLFFPDNGSRLRLTLAEVKLSNRGAPNDLTFKLAGKLADVSKKIQLDEACGP